MSFRRVPTTLSEVVLIEPKVHGDSRGFLVETFRSESAESLGIDVSFVQENHSRSAKDVVRGIHTQRGLAKLVRCSLGRAWDVVVDLRPGSPTFASWEGYELSDDNHRQLFVPPGFGHGFCALTQPTDIVYKLSQYYDPTQEIAIAWDDPQIGVRWPIQEPSLSERDSVAPSLEDSLASLQAFRVSPAP